MKIERVKVDIFRYKVSASEGKVLIDMTKDKPLERAKKEVLRVTVPPYDQYMEVRYDEKDGKVVLEDWEHRYLKQRGVL